MLAKLIAAGFLFTHNYGRINSVYSVTNKLTYASGYHNSPYPFIYKL